nr:hypothetical protein [Tanacetum cinerariifolium]
MFKYVRPLAGNTFQEEFRSAGWCKEKSDGQKTVAEDSTPLSMCQTISNIDAHVEGEQFLKSKQSRWQSALASDHLNQNALLSLEPKDHPKILIRTLFYYACFIIHRENEDGNPARANIKQAPSRLDDKELQIQECTVQEVKSLDAILEDKAYEHCMISFQLLQSHLKLLLNNDLKGTRTEHGFKRAFATIFGQDLETFTGTMFLNMDQLEKQLDKDEFQKTGSMAYFKTIEEKVDTSKALDASLVDTKSSGTKSVEQDTSTRSGNDAHADADIRPIYDEEPMAMVQTTTEINFFAIGQQHT